jgi:hypothetical protein
MVLTTLSISIKDLTCGDYFKDDDVSLAYTEELHDALTVVQAAFKAEKARQEADVLEKFLIRKASKILAAKNGDQIKELMYEVVDYVKTNL